VYKDNADFLTIGDCRAGKVDKTCLPMRYAYKNSNVLPARMVKIIQENNKLT
jgi:hypothetical protein